MDIRVETTDGEVHYFSDVQEKYYEALDHGRNNSGAYFFVIKFITEDGEIRKIKLILASIFSILEIENPKSIEDNGE